jgi:hypothetical protein
MAHNGQINLPGVVKSKDTGSESDTKMFIRKIMRPLATNVPNWNTSVATKRMILDYIGYSRLAFLNSAGQLDIIGEDRGTWDKDQAGAWFSNDSYLPFVKIYGKGNDGLGFIDRIFRTPESSDPPTPSTTTTGFDPESMSRLIIDTDDDRIVLLKDVYEMDGFPVCIDCIRSWEIYLNQTDELTQYELMIDEIGAPIHCQLCNQDVGVH